MYNLFLKRVLDFLISTFGLIVISPVFLTVTLGLFLANKGKPFFFQKRPGLNEKLFKIIKFKTMNDRTDNKGNLLPDADRLTKLGSFLMMGLFGIIIASVVNMFMKSSMMYFVISILGVLIFVGLTAYDTQKIKNMYLASDSGELMGKKAVMGALTLYLDFINLFIMLLRLFGQRR